MDIRQDENGWTHIEWELEDVTPKMLNWWWCNMEKGFALWHPIEHQDFYWLKRPKDGNAIGAIQVAPQVWSDGTLIKPHIRWDDVKTLAPEISSIIIHDHVVVAAGISLTGENVKEDDPPLAYRIHQWEKTDSGVKGISSAIPIIPEPPEKGLVWAAHGSQEIGYFPHFLPLLYNLWKVVKNPAINPYFSFKVIRREGELLYEALKR
ncbi:MAG: hypothetical protein N2745_03105 [Syntrophorhabdaceae bacterium]|nr:hypothetical protein [Syntrophorhabdaceae bacterium]